MKRIWTENIFKAASWGNGSFLILPQRTESAHTKGIISLRCWHWMEKTTAGLISRLEQKGLVAVSGDKEDKRIKYVGITALGETFCKQAEQDMEYMETQLLGDLSPEVQTLLLRRLNIDVFTCLNFHLPRCHPLTQPRYAAFPRLSSKITSRNLQPLFYMTFRPSLKKITHFFPLST